MSEDIAMRKWLITGLLVAMFSGAATTLPWWLPKLSLFLWKNSSVIQGLSSAIQIVLWICVALSFVIGLWQPAKTTRTKKQPGKAVQNTGALQSAGRIAQGSRIDGVYLNANSSLSVGGDLAGRDITKVVIQTHAPAVTAVHQLPAPVPDFVGRQREFSMVVNALRHGDRVAIGSISGMGGIGKTELTLLI